jgi:hypothetical protein
MGDDLAGGWGGNPPVLSSDLSPGDVAGSVARTLGVEACAKGYKEKVADENEILRHGSFVQ